MLLSSTLTVFLLLALMVGSLLMVRLTQDKQETQVIRLYRLAALDRRSGALRKVIQGLKTIDDNPDVVRMLSQVMKSDLQRIQKLDPSRSSNDKDSRTSGSETSKTEKPNAAGLSKADQKTSLGSDREMQRARAHITDALALIRHLYQVGHVAGEQLESTARHLGTLSAMVGVNSNLRMGDEALERGDTRKALSYYRAAESFLHNGPLQGPEAAKKLSYIQQRRTSIADQEAQVAGHDGFSQQAA